MDSLVQIITDISMKRPEHIALVSEGRSLSYGVSEVPCRLDQLLGAILTKRPMSSYGTEDSDVEPFADSVLKYQQVIMSHNPALLTREDVIDIYKDCL